MKALLKLLRPGRGQVTAGVLCLLLGFAIAAQVRSSSSDQTFAGVRQDELVGILSDLSQRSDRTRADIRDLEDTKAQLQRDGQGETALEDARRRSVTYGLLAGTLPATGPGIEFTITDPLNKIRSATLLNALQELRDAGAEVIQLGDRRIGTRSYLLDTRHGIELEGGVLTSPYVFLAIGDPHTLATALGIPGGVVKSVEGAGATSSISPRTDIVIRAVRSS